MSSIRTIQSRDVQSLADTFPDKGYEHFNTLHLDQLQGKCLIFVVTDVDEYDDPIYLGYGCVQWQSEVTAFWRRNIPEIIELIGDETHYPVLLNQIEQAVSEHGLTQVGVYLPTDANLALYQAKGYQQPSFTFTASDDMLYLIKKLA